LTRGSWRTTHPPPGYFKKLSEETDEFTLFDVLRDGDLEDLPRRKLEGWALYDSELKQHYCRAATHGA